MVRAHLPAQWISTPSRSLDVVSHTRLIVFAGIDTEKTYGWSQMRAAAQLACILTLVGYSTSFITNDYDDALGQIFTPDAKIAVLQ